jgi:hypothetical protein
MMKYSTLGTVLLLLAGAIAPSYGSGNEDEGGGSPTFMLDGQTLVATDHGGAVLDLKDLEVGDDFTNVSIDGENVATLSLSLATSPDVESRAWGAGFGERAELHWPDLGDQWSTIVRRGQEIVAITGPGPMTVVQRASEAQSDFFVITAESPMLEKDFSSRLTADEITAVQAGELPVPTIVREWGVEIQYPQVSGEAATPDSLSGEIGFESFSATPASSTFVYRTFIASATAPSGFPVCSPAGDSQYRFVGDNRSYSPTAGTHRTRVAVTFNWTTASTSVARSAGNTHRQQFISGAWTTTETRSSSTSGLTTTVFRMNSSNALVNITVDARNPFCNSAALPIYGTMALEVTRAGNYSINGGSRRTVPHHEAYIKKSTSASWTPVFRLPVSSFSCLSFVNLCPSQSLSSFFGQY